MPYTPQTWSDNNPTYPASAARFTHIENGITDVDSNVSVIKEAPINPIYPEYGAKFDGTTDDSAALAAAIAALPNTGVDTTSGGVIQMPPGDCKLLSPVVLDDLKNVTLRGNGARYGGTRLLVSHTGNGVSAKRALSPVLEQLAIINTSTSYAGKLVDFSSAAAAAPTNFPTLRECRLSMAQQAGITAIGVDLNYSITALLRDLYISGGGTGVYGARAAADFCNAATIEKVYFDHQDSIPIRNLGATGAGSGAVRDCVFEPLRSGSAGAYLQDSTIPFEGTLLWMTNWAGDGDGTGTWVTFNGWSLVSLAEFENAANAILLNGEVRSLAVGGLIHQTAGNGGVNLNGQTVRYFKDLGLYGFAPPAISGTSANYGSGGGGSLAPAAAAVQVVKTGTQSINASTATAVSWDAAGFDTFGTNAQWAIGSPTRLTCKVPGIYRMSAAVVWAADNTGDRSIWFKINGGTVLPGARVAADNLGTAKPSIQASATYILNAGDYVECFIMQTTAGAINVLVNDSGTNMPSAFWMERVS